MQSWLELEILQRKSPKEYYLYLYPRMKKQPLTIEDWCMWYSQKARSRHLIDAQQTFSKRIVEELCLESSTNHKQVYGKIIPSCLEGDLLTTKLPKKQFQLFIEDVVNNATRLGPLQPLLDHPNISDIMVNGLDNIYISYSKDKRNTQTPFFFNSQEHLNQIIDRILCMIPDKSEMNYANPCVNAVLPDGSRINISSHYVSPKGSVLTIRKHVGHGLLLSNLLKDNTMSFELACFLYSNVRNKANLIISGAAGSGKTTLTSVLMSHIPDNERLVVIEDVAELRLLSSASKKNVVRMETRPPNREGAGEIRAKELVENALRMNPDRIIIGECRDGETVDMLQAMNTGHAGSITTVHANNAQDLLSRLEGLVLRSNLNVNPDAAKMFISAAVDYIVHMIQLPSGRRVVSEVYELRGYDATQKKYDLAPIFHYDQEKDLFVFTPDILKKKTPGKDIVDDGIYRVLGRMYRENLSLYTENPRFINGALRFLGQQTYCQSKAYPRFYFVDNGLISSTIKTVMAKNKSLVLGAFLEELEKGIERGKQRLTPAELNRKRQDYEKLSPYISDFLDGWTT
ncbi:CpaF family protein [Candidatus Woesearchaeota archaeon]|nr:CpaF family protein [Candidatus Woesearchaeota archaeon]